MPKHVIIVGAGVVGLCSAWYCVKRGHRVAVIERLAARRDGCSYGNAGLVVPSHFIPLAAPGMVRLGLRWMWKPDSPFYIKPRLSWDLLAWAVRFARAATPERARRSAPVLRDLSLASRECYEELAAETGNKFEFQPRGLLMLAKTPRGVEKEAHLAHEARRLGLEAEVLDATDIARLSPGIILDVAGGVYFPQDAHLDPARLMSVLQERLTAAGVAFHWEREANGWQVKDGRILAVRTATGEIAGDEFVLASGAWSPATARDLKLKLPMQAGKGYSVTLAAPPQLPSLPMILTEARVAVTPIGSSLRFGGTMEIAGRNERIDPRRVQGIIAAGPRYFPAFTANDFVGVAPWCGLRPCTPDGLPYLGRSERHANLTVAAGHAMLGVSLGPITGKIVSRLVTGELSGFDDKLISPDRYR